MMTESVWTEVLIGELTRLWQAGLSTAEIGRRLGISKNAVVGKAHRLHLPPRPSPIKSGLRATPRPAPAVRIVTMGAKAPACQWPHGHPGQPGFHFCGKNAVAGKPYCGEHTARAYVSGKSRSNAA